MSLSTPYTDSPFPADESELMSRFLYDEPKDFDQDETGRSSTEEEDNYSDVGDAEQVHQPRRAHDDAPRSSPAQSTLAIPRGTTAPAFLLIDQIPLPGEGDTEKYLVKDRQTRIASLWEFSPLRNLGGRIFFHKQLLYTNLMKRSAADRDDEPAAERLRDELFEGRICYPPVYKR